MDREAIGPYRIVRILGQGGMGVVLEAIHQAIGRRVAIKVLHAELASNAEYVQRFLNEACAANGINHPSIVDIYDMGSLPDGTTYLVMEFIEGETLGRRIERRGGTLSIEETTWIGREIAVAMAAAHNAGIVHRDLKPDNVMIAMHADSVGGEKIKLLDFGIAKVRPGLGQAKAQTVIGTVMGTLWYMSPEQLKNTADVDGRSDTYSLGALLYHLLAGQPPFRASSEAELIVLNLTQTPAPLRMLAPRVPKPLEELIERMLHKEPAARPSMIEVATQLAAISSSTHASQAISEPTPETFVRHSIIEMQISQEFAPSALDSSSSISSDQMPVAALSSASTMSRAASELRRQQPRDWRWLAIIGAGMLVPSLSIVLWVTLKRPTPGRVENFSAPSAERVNVPSHPTPSPQTTPGSSGTPPLPVTQIPSHSAARSEEEKPHRPVAQRLLVSESCIVDPKGTLSPAQRRAVASAAHMSGLSLVRGQTVRLMREGSRMLVEPRSAISSDKSRFFSGTLRGILAPSQQTVPAEVILKCLR